MSDHSDAMGRAGRPPSAPESSVDSLMHAMLAPFLLASPPLPSPTAEELVHTHTHTAQAKERNSPHAAGDLYRSYYAVHDNVMGSSPSSSSGSTSPLHSYPSLPPAGVVETANVDTHPSTRLSGTGGMGHRVDGRRCRVTSDRAASAVVPSGTHTDSSGGGGGERVGQALSFDRGFARTLACAPAASASAAAVLSLSSPQRVTSPHPSSRYVPPYWGISAHPSHTGEDGMLSHIRPRSSGARTRSSRRGTSPSPSSSSSSSSSSLAARRSPAHTPAPFGRAPGDESTATAGDALATASRTRTFSGKSSRTSNSAPVDTVESGTALSRNSTTPTPPAAAVVGLATRTLTRQTWARHERVTGRTGAHTNRLDPHHVGEDEGASSWTGSHTSAYGTASTHSWARESRVVPRRARGGGSPRHTNTRNVNTNTSSSSSSSRDSEHSGGRMARRCGNGERRGSVRRSSSEFPSSFFQASVYYASPYTPLYTTGAAPRRGSRPRVRRTGDGASGDEEGERREAGGGVGEGPWHRPPAHPRARGETGKLQQQQQQRGREGRWCSDAAGTAAPRQHGTQPSCVHTPGERRGAGEPAANYHRLLHELLRDEERRARRTGAMAECGGRDKIEAGVGENIREGEGEEKGDGARDRAGGVHVCHKSHPRDGGPSAARAASEPPPVPPPGTVNGSSDGERSGRAMNGHTHDPNRLHDDDRHSRREWANGTGEQHTQTQRSPSPSQRASPSPRPARLSASMRYVVGLRQLLLTPRALEEEELDARVWAMRFNSIRRWPSVWDQPQQRRGERSRGGELHVPPTPGRSSWAANEHDRGSLSPRPSLTEPATALSSLAETRARRRARRVGGMKVTVLLAEALLPLSLLLGAPLLISAMAVSGLAVLVPGAAVLAVCAYVTVVRLHAACYTWNLWRSGVEGRMDRPAHPLCDGTAGEPPPSLALDHATRGVEGDGGWLLTTQSLLDLAERHGWPWLRRTIAAVHAAGLLAAAVLVLASGVVLTGGSVSMLSFLVHTEQAPLAGTARYAMYGCEFYPREHLLPLCLPFAAFLLFGGTSTPLRWARYVAYWDTAVFKLGTLGYSVGFACLVAGVHLHWCLRSGSGSGSGSGGSGYPFLVSPRAVAHGEVPALLWLHSWDDPTHWMWRHFTRSLELHGQPAPTGVAGRWASLVDYAGLHLSVSVALLTWVLGFLVFVVRAGTSHFFVMPLLWRGRRRRPWMGSTGASRRAPVEEGEVAVDVSTAGAQAPCESTPRTPIGVDLSVWVRRLREYGSKGRRWLSRSMGVFSASGFGSSITIALLIFASATTLLTLVLVVGTPLSATNLAAPLHLRLLWTAVTVEQRADRGVHQTKNLESPAALTTFPPPSLGHGPARPRGGTLREETLLCDLGIQAGLPRPVLIANAVASLLLGLLCCAWVPYFLSHASSAIASTPLRGAHARTPQQLLEASLRAFVRSRWAVARREAPAEVRAYLSAPPMGSTAATTTAALPVGARRAVHGRETNNHNYNNNHSSSDGGSAPRRGRPRACDARVTPTARARTQPPSVPLRSVPPHQLFRLNSAFMLFPELHRATTRTGVPIRIDQLHQHLQHSTQDLFYFNNRCFFRSRARPVGDGGGGEDEGSTPSYPGALLCRRLFASLLVPGSRIARDGFAVRAWALVTEFTLLRLPFLLLVMILTAMVIAGPTARCARFWSVLSLLRAWGHYDGVRHRSDTHHHHRSSGSTVKDDEAARMCEEPMLISIDATITSRLLLAAASFGGLLLAPLLFGVPVTLLLRARLLRRTEARAFQALFERAVGSTWVPRVHARGGASTGPRECAEPSRHGPREGGCDRERLLAGGLAGARFFAQQQADTRRHSAALLRRAPAPLPDEDLSRSGWASRWLGFQRAYAQPSPRGPTAAALRLPVGSTVLQCRCEPRPAAHTAVTAMGPADAQGPRTSTAEEAAGGTPAAAAVAQGSVSSFCGFCMARHRRWWAEQRRLSRIAVSEPRLPAVEPEFYLRHRYRRVLTRTRGVEGPGEDADVRTWVAPSTTQQDAEAQPLLGRALDEEEGAVMRVATRESAGSTGAGAATRGTARPPRQGHGGWKSCSVHSVWQLAGGVARVAFVALLVSAWALAAFGSVRAISLLY